MTLRLKAERAAAEVVGLAVGNLAIEELGQGRHRRQPRRRRRAHGVVERGIEAAGDGRAAADGEGVGGLLAPGDSDEGTCRVTVGGAPPEWHWLQKKPALPERR